MPRRNLVSRRIPAPDSVYQSPLVTRFINKMLSCGKRNTAARLFYQALDLIKLKTNQEPIDVFNKAMKNVSPLVEVKARRVGGSTYQVPIEVKQVRGVALATQWLITNSRKRQGRTFSEKLSLEIIDASNNTGASIRKRDETHKMAEANKAFAHYRY